MVRFIFTLGIDAVKKTFTIIEKTGAHGARVIEFWLMRYGKKHAQVSGQGADVVTPVWKLRRHAIELGATHIRLPHGVVERADQ